MKRMLRNLSIAFLTVALLCAWLPMGAVSVAAEAVGDNLYTNGDFETGAAGEWIFTQNTTVDAVSAHSGNYGVHLMGNGGWGGLLKRIVPITAGNSYKLSFWIKCANSGVNMSIKENDKDGAALTTSYFSTTNYSEWKQYTYEFTAGVDALYINFNGPGNNKAEDVYIDDFQLLCTKTGEPQKPEEPQEPSGDNIYTNGDFETGAAGEWLFYQNTTVDAVSARSGNYGVHLLGNGGWGGLMNRIVPITAGNSYKLSFWIKCANSGVNMKIKEDNKDGAQLTTAYFSTTNYSEWKQYTYEFTAGANALYINFNGPGNDKAEDVYIDDMELICTKVGTPVTPPADDGDNLLVNGDFEIGDIDGWEYLWSPSVSSEMVAGYESNYAVKVTANQWHSLRQAFVAIPYADYRITFRAKDCKNMTMLAKGNENLKEVVMSEGSEWKEYSFEFNSDYNSTVYIMIMGNSADGATGIVDNVVVELLGTTGPAEPEGTDLMVNGGFETGTAGGWYTWQSTEITPTAAYAGKFGAHLKGNGGWGGLINQTIPVKKGKNYRLSFFLKANSNGVNVQLRSEHSEGEKLAGNWYSTSNCGEWKEIVYLFTAPGDSVFLNLNGGGNGIPEDVYLDEVRLICTNEDDPDNPIPNTIITGGQSSVRDAANGSKALAFLFKVHAAGASMDANKAYVANSATVTPYYNITGDFALVRAGALVTNDATIGADAEQFLPAAVNGSTVKDVTATYLWSAEENAYSFAVRVVNIPDAATARDIYLRPYYVYKDAEGNEVMMYGDTKFGNYDDASNPKSHLKVLAIGNSFSVDAMNNHLYPILQDAGYEDIVLGNLYIGGCDLDTHWSNLSNDSAAYAYYKNDSGKWVTYYNHKASAALIDEDWDYIVVQQVSGSSGRPSTYGNFENIVNYVNSHKSNPNAHILWHMTWAYHTETENWSFTYYDKDQMTMYNAITDTVQSKVLANALIEGVFPSGTAIQNMRTSGIDGALLHEPDGYHLSSNYGDYIAALTWYAYLSGDDVSAITYQPDEIAPYREAVNQAVMAAVANPFEVTDVTAKVTRSVAAKAAVVYGDVNGDGKVNNRDLGVLQQYLNDYEITIDLTAADVTHDGKVNNRDLGLLQQYLNDWDVTLDPEVPEDGPLFNDVELKWD